MGRYTVAEPTGHVREVKYTADEKHGFQADVKIHPPGTFGMKIAEKRSAVADENEDKNEEAQSDKTSEEVKEEHQADDSKNSEEMQNDKPQQPEEMTDEEVEKTLEKQEHILNPQEHEHSNTDEQKSADAGSKEQDNLVITINAEKKDPVQDVKSEDKQPVHVTHAVKDPTSQPAYPFSPNFYSPYPYGARIPHPAVSDSPHPAHHTVAEHPHIPHPAVMNFHVKAAAPVPAPAPVIPPPQQLPISNVPALLPSFIYQDHPISPVSPLFIQQPSHQAHHYLPGNVQDILAAKQATLQDVENMVRHATADESKHEERYAAHGFQIHPKPMMFQLSDPPTHVLLPSYPHSNQVDQSFKALNYLAPQYPYSVPYYYQPTQDGLGRGAIPQYYIDNEVQKSIFSNFDLQQFYKPIVSNIPPQYLPQKLRPVSSTPATLNADQVSSTSKPEVQQHIEVQINKGQTPAPATASTPSHYFNFPFLYPLTTFLQRPFLHHQPQATQPQVSVQKDQVQQQQEDPQKLQKPVAQSPQSVAATVPNEQQRYYVIQPNFQSNGQYRYNPGQSGHPTPPAQQKPAAAVKSAPARQAVPSQAPVSYSPAEKSSNLYSFPYNSPVALLVLPMDQQPQHNNAYERKGVKHSMDSYYRK